MDLIEAQDVARGLGWLSDDEPDVIAVPVVHIERARRRWNLLNPQPVDPEFKAWVDGWVDDHRELLDRLADS